MMIPYNSCDIECNMSCYTIFKAVPLGDECSVHRVIVGILFAIFAPIAIILNGLLIVSFVATDQVKLNSANFLITCLGVSDMFIGIFVFPLQSYFLLNYTDCMENYCTWAIWMQTIAVCTYELSAYLTVLVAVDRYIHMNPNIERPSRFAVLFKKPFLYLLLLGGVALSSTIAILYALVFKEKKDGAAATSLVAVMVTFIILAIIVITYAHGYKRIRQFTLNSPIYKNQGCKPRYLRSLFKTVLILISTLLCTHLPIFLSHIILVVDRIFDTLHGNFRLFALWSYVIMFLNCMLNSLIILRTNDKSKKWIKEWYIRKILNRAQRLSSRFSSWRETISKSISSKSDSENGREPDVGFANPRFELDEPASCEKEEKK